MNKEESLLPTIQQLEEHLFKPEIRQSPIEVSKLLAKNFVEFGSSGQIFDKQTIIDAMIQHPIVRISAVDFKISILAPDIVSATYRAIIVIKEGEPEQHSLRKSIWELIDDSWQMVFHQGTSIPAP